VTFVHRRIDVTFTKGSGGFEGEGNSVKLSKVRVAARVSKAGGNSFGQLQATVWGLTLSRMNQLTTLGQKVQTVSKDKITISAGDSAHGMSVAFEGNIFNAYADLQSAPQGGFVVSAQTEYANSVAPTPALSYSGGVDAADICKELARKMNLKFENNGVSVMLSDPYFSGSPLNQLERVCTAANISYAIDAGVLAIWKKNGFRGSGGSDQVPLVSPSTGLISYPTYTASGIKVRSLYNPAIEFGKRIKLESDLKAATGLWTVYAMDYDLEAEVPGGKWEMNLDCYNPDFGLVVRT